MQTEHKIEGETPFQEDCNTSLFFSGGGRGAVLDDLKAAFQEGVDLITLIGEEGSGKTMLCKMLQEKWRFPGRVIFLPQLVESFEDIVRIAAQECNVQFPVEANRVDARKIFLDLVGSLRQQEETLLIICDEAERMYLATLERIRKILDEINREGGGLQVLLSGRASLRGNLEQLDLCNFEQISEKQFFLSPLDENDTWKYLNFCMQVQKENGPREVFAKEAADKIASMARGNLRMINILAEESLKSSSADTSFMVLLDHVNDSCSIEEMLPNSPGILQRVLERLPLTQKQLAAGGGGLLLLILILVFSGDDEQGVTEQVQKGEEQVASSPSIEKKVTLKPVEVSGEKESGKTAPAMVAEKIQPPVVTIAPVEIAVASPPVERVTSSEESILPPSVDETPEPVHPPPAVKTEEPTPPSGGPVAQVERPAPVPERQVENEVAEELVSSASTPVEIAPVEILESVAEPVVPELLAHGKFLPGGATKRIVAVREKQLAGLKKEVSGKEGDPVLVDMIGAGEEWQAGTMDDQFTIQLMVLTSDQAEENLKRIVSQEEYSEVVDRLVVLKRPSDPPVVLVFYGIYPTMAAARNARTNLPLFFRKYHPYAISVRGAVEKGRFQ